MKILRYVALALVLLCAASIGTEKANAMASSNINCSFWVPAVGVNGLTPVYGWARYCAFTGWEYSW